MDSISGIKLKFKIPLDIFIAVLVVLPAAILNLSATPYQRGFYCDDHSVRYPYKPDTISSTVLVVVGGLVPIISIIIWERILFVKYQSHGSSCQTKYLYDTVSISPTLKLNGYFVALYKYVGGFMFGGFINQSLTDSSKFIIGRLRPHFLSACAIEYAKYCPQGYNTFMYIENINCTGDGNLSEHKLRDARLSFPSGHASFAFYAFIFLVIYLHFKMDWYSLLRSILQTISFTLAWLTALSRVSDYKHHAGDVIGGGLLGTAVALLTALYICGLMDVYKRSCIIENRIISSVVAPPRPQDYGTIEIESRSTAVNVES
ncbi:phospholipid phosphatase 1-like [Antedon mediterranea]|uniref:phospholipid phosphatase 1-like n=1 Tax=Antedon mediterranea TaxID=105859 RepID=UPI003AF72557